MFALKGTGLPYGTTVRADEAPPRTGLGPGTAAGVDSGSVGWSVLATGAAMPRSRLRVAS